MKSQQILANFMNSRADYFCRMCFANFFNKDDIIYDIVQNDRYHHDTILIRAKENSVKTINIENVSKRIIKAQRETFFSSQDMLTKTLAFQRMTSKLDLIHSKSEDSTHSEFFDIVKRIMSIFCNEILLSKFLERFSKLFRKFFLTSD